MFEPSTRFLVVDDMSTMRRIVRSLLRGLGFNDVEEAENGAEAFKKLTAGTYDFLITDWNMPVMTGLELLKQVRATESIRSLPVLLVTAEAKREYIVEAASAGTNGYILKPFTAATLEEKLQGIYKRLNG